jgi:hypothetical protein
MPRPNKRRGIFAEEHLAQRIAAERDRPDRKWSNDGLAKRMTDAGCPMTGSAIFKIEKAEPRRRIVVDELVTFARVFGITVDQLLLDPEIEAEQRLIDKLNSVNTLATAHEDAAVKLIAAVDEVRELVKGSKRTKAAVNKYLMEIREPREFIRVTTALYRSDRLDTYGGRPDLQLAVMRALSENEET